MLRMCLCLTSEDRGVSKQWIRAGIWWYADDTIFYLYILDSTYKPMRWEDAIQTEGLKMKTVRLREASVWMSFVAYFREGFWFLTACINSNINMHIHSLVTKDYLKQNSNSIRDKVLIIWLYSSYPDCCSSMIHQAFMTQPNMHHTWYRTQIMAKILYMYLTQCDMQWPYKIAVIDNC